MTELPDIKEEPKKTELMQRGGDIFMDILEDNILEVTGDEISLELDLSILKIKRKLKQVMTFRSFDCLGYYCDALGVIESLRMAEYNLYSCVSETFG